MAFFLGQFLLSAPARTRRSGAPGRSARLRRRGLYIFLLGLFALGFGTIIRHTAGAISAFVAMLLMSFRSSFRRYHSPLSNKSSSLHARGRSQNQIVTTNHAQQSSTGSFSPVGGNTRPLPLGRRNAAGDRWFVYCRSRARNSLLALTRPAVSNPPDRCYLHLLGFARFEQCLAQRRCTPLYRRR